MEMKISEIFKAIAETAGSTAKKELLRVNDNDTIAQIFDYTYGGRKYYVKKYSPKSTGDWTLDDRWDIVKEVLDKLANRELTGSFAVVQLECVASRFTAEDQDLIKKIVDGNLKIGISLKGYQDVNANTVKTVRQQFPCALAVNLDKTKGINVLDGNWFASRKLDGVRCICIARKNGDIQFFSRSNKEFFTLDNVIPAMADLIRHSGYDELYFDGECCILDENGDEHFDWIMQEIGRKNHTIAKPCYNIFDVLTPDEYFGKVTSPNFEERLDRLTKIFECAERPHSTIKQLKQERIFSQDDFDRWSQYVADGDWEGFMLRKNVPFEGERTKNLLKVKKFQDAEYVVEDVTTGKIVFADGGNKEYDVVSALVIRHKGNPVQVGSGLSKEQRLAWFKDPSQIIGKTVTIQYFEETTNKTDNSLSLRFPVLKAVYDGARTI